MKPGESHNVRCHPSARPRSAVTLAATYKNGIEGSTTFPFPQSTNLGNLQQSMAQLVRAGAVAAVATDPVIADYLQVVSQSTGLKVMREVVRDWRHLLLRQGCPLTTGALVGAACFAESVDQYMTEQSLDPLAQGLSARFMAWVGANRDDDVASVAQFERALINVRRGITSTAVVVQWKCHPMEALAAALHAQPLPPSHPVAIYVTEVAAHLPGEFVIRTLSTEHATATAR